MASTPLRDIRNIGIISHIDAGKTTVSERILYYTGEIHRLGEVHDGAATMDWMEQEQERGITITASNTSCRWKNHWINLIDTPGHIDFTIEVERSLRVLDGAVAIFSAVEGVQPQSESVWRQAERYSVPRVCLVNKMDRVGADYRRVLAQMEKKLAARPVLLQLPVGEEHEFGGVIDLASERMLTFAEADLGQTVEESDIPDHLRDAAREARERVIEAAADFDETILENFLEGQAVGTARLNAALRRGTLENRITPVLLGSALRNKGIQPLLDAVIALLPSPLEVPPVAAHRPGGEESVEELPCDPEGPLCALAFKVLSDQGRKLTYLRLYSGRLHAGDTLWNSTREIGDRVARLFRMHSHKRERIDEARAGDIVAAAGLKEVLTGDTLCSSDSPYVLAGLSVPEPVVSLAVEPRGVDDRDKFEPSLEKLIWEDPTFLVREDKDTGQTILTGMGELHLEVILNRLEREFGVRTNSGTPQVVYRETIRGPVEHHEVFRREVEGRTQVGEITLRLEPLERNRGTEVVLPPADDSPLPGELLEVVRQSLEQAAASGARTGYPLTDIRIEADDIPYDANETSEIGLRAATQRGLAMAARDADVTLLEPVMTMEIVVPSEHAGKVLGSIQQKRGRIEGMATEADVEVIQALVPLAETFGYMTELRSSTQGRGTFTMEFSHFGQAPPETLERFGLK